MSWPTYADTPCTLAGDAYHGERCESLRLVKLQMAGHWRSIPHHPSFWYTDRLIDIGCGSKRDQSINKSKVLKIWWLWSVWCLGTCWFFHILRVRIPTDQYFSEGVKRTRDHCCQSLSWGNIRPPMSAAVWVPFWFWPRSKWMNLSAKTVIHGMKYDDLYRTWSYANHNTEYY